MPPAVIYPLKYAPGQSPVRRWAEVIPELRAADGAWNRATFRIDTGVSITTMSGILAGPMSATNPNGLNLPLPTPPAPG